VDFTLEIILKEIAGAKTLYIPLVQIFVTEQTNEVEVFILMARHEALAW
jgi:hypothetical protein